MHKTEKLILIEGTFESEEAKEILMNIFTTKITFHQRNNFSFQERFGKDHETAKKRIPALQKEVMKLRSIIELAEAQNKKLQIHSEITISMTDK